MRRPGIRSLAGGAAGIIAGVIGGIALTLGLGSRAGPRPLQRGSTPSTFRPCSPGRASRPRSGTRSSAPRVTTASRATARATSMSARARAGRSSELTLNRGEDSSEGRYFVDLPPEICLVADGLLVLRDSPRPLQRRDDHRSGGWRRRTATQSPAGQRDGGRARRACVRPRPARRIRKLLQRRGEAPSARRASPDPASSASSALPRSTSQPTGRSRCSIR